MRKYTRRDFIKTVAAGTAAAALPFPFMMDQADAARKPNVIILFIDDLGYGDLGCFGNKRTPTPHIDSMAAKGAKCTMSYITNPPCSPSRCCLITGMYAQRFGKSGMARGLPIPNDHPTMAEFMRDAGYVTGQIGKWDIGSKEQGPHQRGFMQVAKYAPGKHYMCKKEDGATVYRTDADGDYMVEFVERNRNKPFFLYFSPFAIHSPLKQTPQHYKDRVKGGKGTPYEGAVIAVDDAVGKLLAVLKKYNLEKNTLIMLTGDNGANLKEGGSSAPYRGGKFSGNTIFEGWVHTPTIVYWPGTIPAGFTYEGLMCTMDFYATAAAAAGRSLPKRCEGKNLLPYVQRKKPGDVHEYLFWHNADPTDSKHRNLYAVRWKNWRLVKHKNDWRLFDLKKDPKERNNLANSNKKVVDHMKKQYDAFVATLPPIKPSKNYNRPRNYPQGWGWVMGDGKG
jgi:arylsulfatase A-like enzyme